MIFHRYRQCFAIHHNGCSTDRRGQTARGQCVHRWLNKSRNNKSDCRAGSTTCACCYGMRSNTNSRQRQCPEAGYSVVTETIGRSIGGAIHRHAQALVVVEGGCAAQCRGGVAGGKRVHRWCTWCHNRVDMESVNRCCGG